MKQAVIYRPCFLNEVALLTRNYISVFQLDVKFLESEIFKEEKLLFVS